MITGWRNFRTWRILAVLVLSVFGKPDIGAAQAEAELDRHAVYTHRYVSFWNRLIPRYGKLQFAGNMGLLSAGVGWDYGKGKKWETDLLFGFLPRYSSRKGKATFTLKQNFIPWNLPVGRQFEVSPLTCGIYLNTLFSNQFWKRQPDRYPDGYYEVPTRVRVHIFAGQQFSWIIPKHKSFFAERISVFYEISTYDMLLISSFTNRYLKPKDYLSLSFGLRVQYL